MKSTYHEILQPQVHIYFNLIDARIDNSLLRKQPSLFFFKFKAFAHFNTSTKQGGLNSYIQLLQKNFTAAQKKFFVNCETVNTEGSTSLT